MGHDPDETKRMREWVEKSVKELRETPEGYALTRNLRVEERAGLVEGGENGHTAR